MDAGRILGWRPRTTRRAFTLLEGLMLLSVGLLVVVVLVVIVGAPTRRPVGDVYPKDLSQLRGLLYGLEYWAKSNGDRYPLPSALDTQGWTVPEVGGAKDTTANIYSVLIYNGILPPDMFVSSKETNPNIVADDDYAYESPRAAVDPSRALWDPAFSADFTGPGKGNASFAHMPPVGARAELWRPNGSAQWRAVVGNRGPRISSVAYQDDGDPDPTLANPASNTLRMNGLGGEWGGYIGFADGHVDYCDDMIGGDMADMPTFRDAGGVERPDVLFFDEPEDSAGTNNFLGIFTRAGPEPGDLSAIWD